MRHLGDSKQVLGRNKYTQVADAPRLSDLAWQGVTQLQILQANVSTIHQVACLGLLVLVAELYAGQPGILVSLLVTVLYRPGVGIAIVVLNVGDTYAPPLP